MDKLPTYNDEYTEGDTDYDLPHTYYIEDESSTFIYVEADSKAEVLELAEAHISNLLSHLLTSLDMVREARYEIKKSRTG
jgi:hypothetical protein